nr:immunoglobulin heavy chain junction region [Mus musculus]
CTRYWGYFDYW